MQQFCKSDLPLAALQLTSNKGLMKLQGAVNEQTFAKMQLVFLQCNVLPDDDATMTNQWKL
jgi:hypothetical protein